MRTISKSIRVHFFIAEKLIPGGRIWPRDSQAGSKKGHFWEFFRFSAVQKIGIG